MNAIACAIVTTIAGIAHGRDLVNDLFGTYTIGVRKARKAK